MEEHKYPLRLTTEASIDLADDPELLELMYQANFRSVFIGIETPRAESLKETKKFQNVRGDSLEAKLGRIQAAGLDINGFIVGFDSDDKAIFDDQFRFIQDNGITLAMVGMLQAIPRTPLYDRLRAEGRLVEEDPSCNFVPKQMTRDELRQGYWDLVTRLYTPEAYLERFFKVCESKEYMERRPPSAGGRARKVDPDPGLWTDAALVAVLAPSARWFAAVHRRSVCTIFLRRADRGQAAASWDSPSS